MLRRAKERIHADLREVGELGGIELTHDEDVALAAARLAERLERLEQG